VARVKPGRADCVSPEKIGPRGEVNSRDNLKDPLVDLAELRRRAGDACAASKELREKHRAIISRVVFYEQACALKVEGIVSKRADAPYAPSNRGLWLKVKCLNREEFVVIGWTDPEGSRPWLGALLLGYYDPTVGWSMPGASEPESAMRSLNVCGAASNR